MTVSLLADVGAMLQVTVVDCWLGVRVTACHLLVPLVSLEASAFAGHFWSAILNGADTYSRAPHRTTTRHGTAPLHGTTPCTAPQRTRYIEESDAATLSELRDGIKSVIDVLTCSMPS